MDNPTVEPVDDPRLEAWERRTSGIIIAAAILPIVVGLTERGQSEQAVWLDLGSWAIFIADFVVHLLWKRGFLRSNLGKFDLTIVVLTAPWYLVPGLANARILGFARLARLGRVFIASTKSAVLRELGQRLGRAALYSLVLMVCCSFVVEAVEPPSSGFTTFGDAMWWAIVTFTTVGYGDLYPVTTTGRLAGVLLMIGGVALIGTLAGSLGSFFTSESDASEEADPTPPGASGPDSEFQDRVLAELGALRAEVEQLRPADPP